MNAPVSPGETSRLNEWTVSGSPSEPARRLFSAVNVGEERVDGIGRHRVNACPPRCQSSPKSSSRRLADEAPTVRDEPEVVGASPEKLARKVAL